MKGRLLLLATVDELSMDGKPNKLEIHKMNNPLLTKTEFYALCSALHGGIFDSVSGAELRRAMLIDEVTDAMEGFDLEDDELGDLHEVVEKIESLSEEAVGCLLDLVNATYRLSLYADVSQKLEDGCICDDCRERLNLN